MDQQFFIERGYEYDLRDLAVAFYAVARKRYGESALSGYKKHFWNTRGQIGFTSVKINHHEEAVGVRGHVVIKSIPANFLVAGEGPNIVVFGVRENARDEVMAFLDAIAKHLEHESIFRGKAIDSSGEFLDLSGVSLDDVVYNDKVLRDLRAHVWTIIKGGDRCAVIKNVNTRKVLFAGPFGSGKTLAALLTAQIALQHGYTFFYIKPTDKGGHGIVRTMLAFARKYQPAIALIEDCDREQREGNPFEHGAIMAEIDGIKSKNGRMIVIMTTNYEDSISKGMRRPGRIDKVIDFGKFTTEDAKRLLQKVIPPLWLSPSINWEAVTGACAKFAPAFVEEVGKAAMLLAVSATDNETPVISDDILVEAANDLRAQHDKSNGKIGF